MKNTKITLEEIRNLDETSKEMIYLASQLTSENLDLLIEILNLIIDSPDREQFSHEYVNKNMGKMKDLPALLAQI